MRHPSRARRVVAALWVMALPPLAPAAAQDPPRLPQVSRAVPSLLVPDFADPAARRTFEAEFRRLCSRDIEILAETRASPSPRGALLAQDPAPGARLSCTAGAVTLILSAGSRGPIGRLPVERRLPDLRVTPVEPVTPEPPTARRLIIPDLSKSETRLRFAREVLEFCNRPLDLREETTESSEPAGSFLGQRPPPGVALSCRMPRVFLRLSAGPAPPPPQPEPEPEPPPQPPPQPEPPRPEPRPPADPAPPAVAPEANPNPVPGQQPLPPEGRPSPEPAEPPMPAEARPPAPEPRQPPPAESQPPPPGDDGTARPDDGAGSLWPWLAGGALLLGGGAALLARTARRPATPETPEAGLQRGTGQVTAALSGPLALAGPVVSIRWRMPPPVVALLPQGGKDG